MLIVLFQIDDLEEYRSTFRRMTGPLKFNCGQGYGDDGGRRRRKCYEYGLNGKGMDNRIPKFNKRIHCGQRYGDDGGRRRRKCYENGLNRKGMDNRIRRTTGTQRP